MTLALDMILSDPYRPDAHHGKLMSACWMVGFDGRPLDDAKDLLREAGYPWMMGYADAFERGHKDRMEAL